MEIGDWASAGGIVETYRSARELGLETNLAELEAFGFTIVPPDRTGAPADFAARLLDRIGAVADEEDAAAVGLNQHEATKPADGRQLFHLLARDSVFIEAMMNPVVRTLGAYVLGRSFRFSGMVAFLKEAQARPTRMHCDSVGTPSPLPFYSTVCNLSWILTDYTVENGTLGMVPGSHRNCRHPTESEQPIFCGGQMDPRMVAPIVAPRGSLAVFTGNTWHCTFPKTNRDMRAHLAMTFSRNFVAPAETFADLPDDIVGKWGEEFARLLGRTAWQGYGAEGPQLERLTAVYAAGQSSYA
jgi:ectoine hydroxylase-related dioxygenase (phytanoyl-CoA dioxygenase family)